MTKLTRIQFDHLQQMLSEREQALQSHLQREDAAREDFVQVASEVPDSGDSSFATLSIDLDNAAVSRDMTELRAIEATRQRMHRGEYGECVQCGCEIPYDRLLAQPTAVRCAPCQNIFERTHAETGIRTSM
jgi:DnaK suppressor protein